jgi:hypothetical protein
MTRLALSAGLAALTILLALATAVLQSQNRSRGLALDSLKEECDMLEAANGEGCERILARDNGPLPLGELAEKRPAKTSVKGPVAP